MKPHVIILRGPCGGGKTTIAQMLTKRLNSEHIEIDAVKTELSGGTSASSWAEIESWFHETNKRLVACLEHHKVAVVDEAFSEPALFNMVVDGLAEKVGITVVEIKYSPDEHIRRYAKKTKNVHPTDEVIRRFYDEYNTGILPKADAAQEIINDLSFSDPDESVDTIVEKIIDYMSKHKVSIQG